ncbi:hypothetical protein [Streptomyces zingiberis]|uniref:DUF4352 domain-containing protein n=1 Tax=Streptomyces zingiberis TaxID=2053010 RepID=A0ABX1BXP3_9ACTN|nr:hypothetical protein [Streptomyces zingiberis]NJQ01265.1 hypothetical protein [Streptomyces zingiberis]
MSDDEETNAPASPGTGPAGDDGGSGIGPLSRRIIGWCTLVTVVIGALTAILGFGEDVRAFLPFGKSDAGPPAATGTPSPSAGVSGTSGSAPRCGRSEGHDVLVGLEGKPTRSGARVVATVTCVVRAGDHLSWVVRKETGDPDRPLRYTLRYDLGEKGPGKYVYDAELGPTEPGSERSLFVVLLDEAAYREVKRTTDSENYVRLPSPVPAVSNSVLVTTPED